MKLYHERSIFYLERRSVSVVDPCVSILVPRCSTWCSNKDVRLRAQFHPRTAMIEMVFT